MDEFAIDLDKVLDEFEETEGCQTVCDGAKHGVLLEPRDTELDLSEANFAPAHCAVLLKSCMANGNEPDTQAFNTAVSDSTVSPCNEHHVVDSGTHSSLTHVTCDGIQNGEASDTASVQYDAIGLPLCTENLAASNCYGTLTADNDILVQHNTEAAEELSTDCDVGTGRHDVDGGLMTSADDSGTINASTSISACGGQDVTGPSDESSTCLMSDKNITGEESGAVDPVIADHGNIVSSTEPFNGGNLVGETSSDIELNEQNTRNMQLDIDDAPEVVAECYDLSVSGDDTGSPTAPTVGEIQGEMQVLLQPGESLTVDDIKRFEVEDGELHFVRETQVAREESVTLDLPQDVEELDDGEDEVDKIVSCSVQSHSATATERSVDAEAVCPDHSPENASNLTANVAACSESSWLEAEGAETCGVDRVERITTNDVAKCWVVVKLDSCIDVVNVDEDLSHAACGLESDHVTSVNDAMDMNEVAVCTMAQVLCETGSGGTDAVTNSALLQSDAQSPVDTECHTASLPVPALLGVSTAAAETAVSLLDEKLADIADRMYDVPAAGSENQVDSSETLQQKHVSEESYLSHESELSDIIQSDNEPSSLNDVGDAQDVESCQKESAYDDSNNWPVVSDAVTMDTKLVADYERLPVEADNDVQLNGDMSDVAVKKVNAKVPCYTASSTEPPLHHLDFSISSSREEEQDRCGLNDTVMPSELAGFRDTLIGESMAVDTSPFNEHTSNSIAVGVKDNERDWTDVDAVAMTRTQSTDDLPVQDQDQTGVRRQLDEGRPGMKMQSDEDAERWFEEQFAACEAFDVDEFVSAAWTEFHPDMTDSAPAVGRIHDEMLEQHPAAAAAAASNDSDTGQCKATEVESADAWHHIKNEAVAASAVDDLMNTPSSELSQFVDSEMDAVPSCISSSTIQYGEPSAPVQPSAESVSSFHEEQVADNSSPTLQFPLSPPPYVGPPVCANINLPITQLGKIAPVWRPDSDTATCMQCDIVFTFTRRRHHCRACGKVFCNNCCNLKATLPIVYNKETRVCSKCYQDLIRAQIYERSHAEITSPHEYYAAVGAQPTPLIGAEGGTQPAMMPTGVLRKRGSVRSTVEPKQVMFSDGIRPGGDLTELDGTEAAAAAVQPASRRAKKVDKSAAAKTRALLQSKKAAVSNLVPNDGFPPVLTTPLGSTEFSVHENPSSQYVLEHIQKADVSTPVVFVISRNLLVFVRVVTLSCCMRRTCWSFTSRGLCTVGQDDIVILLECLPDETLPPTDVFQHIALLYDQASQGSFGSQDVGGYLYIRQSYQCLQQLTLPEPPFLFAVLLQKWEMPWARAFPLRLMLRLGAEFRYYPCPLLSVRKRKPVYGEIGHTIMNLLADFHNFQYTLPQINSLLIHMEDKQTCIQLPRARYSALMKVLDSSDDHVVAFGGSFSMAADSHLVCIQNDDGQYQTQAINIQNRPRRVTGACFVVLNGALKLASGLRAKSSIIEDGLMVQVTAESLAELKQSLRDMKDYVINCGSTSSPQPDEVVRIEWIDDEHNVNAGVKSVVDGLSLDGIDSLRIHTATDYISKEHVIRWTELFFVSYGCGSDVDSQPADPAELSRLAEHLAQAFCLAVTPYLEPLAATEMVPVKIGLRVTVGSEQVGYEVGCGGTRLPDYCMNDLDEKLIPVMNAAVTPPTSGQPVVIELIFYILHQPPSASS